MPPTNLLPRRLAHALRDSALTLCAFVLIVGVGLAAVIGFAVSTAAIVLAALAHGGWCGVRDRLGRRVRR